MFIIQNLGKIEDFYDVEPAKIGEGSYARVCACSNQSTGAQRAVKICEKTRRKRIRKGLQQELEIMRKLDHPNIVKLYEHFEDKKYTYFILELCEGGELYDRLVQLGHFTEAQTAVLMQQIFRGVFHMHARKVCHRDLKMENFLLRTEDPVENNRVKICDFGLSKVFQEGEPMTSKCGAPYYTAPQVLAGSYTQASDMWSLGIIMYILLCGYPPFFGDTDAQILSKVRAGIFSFNEADWKDVSEYAKQMIRDLLKMNQQQRLTVAQALSHEWLVQKAPKRQAPLKLRFTDSLRAYSQMNMLKRTMLQTMANQLDEEYTKPLVDTFMWLDRSGEGCISAQELLDGLKMIGYEPDEIPADLEDIFAKVDVDGSGEITYTEWVAGTLESKIYTREEVIWGAFRIFDRKGVGRIGPNDLRELWGDDVTKEACKAMIEQATGGKDKYLDFNSFSAVLKGDQSPATGRKLPV